METHDLISEHGPRGPIGAAVCKIVVNGGAKVVTAAQGDSLLNGLTAANIFLPSACGGRGICRQCRVRIVSGGGALNGQEGAKLSPLEIEQGVRLACQVRISQDVAVEVPADLLAIKEYTAQVEEMAELTYDIRRFTLRLLEPRQLRFNPGQYVQMQVPPYLPNSEEISRAYSIASDPAKGNRVDLIMRRVLSGISTTYFFDHLSKGDEVRFSGPNGEFRLSSSQSQIIFIAGGSGMAPIASMLHQLRNIRSCRKAAFFFGGNTVRDIFMQDQMRQFEQDLPDFKFIPVVANVAKDEQWPGQRGLVTEAVERYACDASTAEAYLCGSPGMIDAAIAMLVKKGLTGDRIFFDKFS